MAARGFSDVCYWTDTARPIRTPASPLSSQVEVDIAIVGGGIVGVVAARLLKDRGLTVAIVEAGRLGHGVTGRSTAKVTAQHSTFLHRIERDHDVETARAYAEANLAGVELIATLTRQHELDCDLGTADSCVYATTEDGLRELEAEEAAAERCGLPMQLVHDMDLPFPVQGGLRLAEQRQFQPADFVAQLGATIPGDGSSVFEQSAVTEWDEHGVQTVDGSVRADRVIMATHLPLGQVGQYHAHTSPHMHAVLALPIDGGRVPAGMYISVDEPKRSIRTHRNQSGDTFLILTGTIFKHGDWEAETAAFAELEQFARNLFGWKEGGYRWTNEDYSPRDGLPYVGWSGSEGKSLLVATGFDAWGLSNGAAAALMLADACEDRENPWLRYFDASRHSVGGLGKLAGNAAAFVQDLVGGHADKPPAAQPEQMTEGAVVYVDGRAAGLYEDNGDLRAVSAVCTHMGCLVGWNPVDRTWDCPCHGSRFAADGRVVHGPATEPLAPVQLSQNKRGKDGRAS